MIAYVNLRHAGTGFVVRKLCAGMKATQIESADAGHWDLAWGHVHENNLDAVRGILRRSRAAFTSFRGGIEESCLKRGECLATLLREKALMLDLLAEFEILPLHIDLPGIRERELEDINGRCGLHLATDWVRVPSLLELN